MKKISFNKLWKKLIDSNLTKTQFRKEINISSTTLAKLGKNEQVNFEIILKICDYFNCDINDILEISENDK